MTSETKKHDPETTLKRLGVKPHHVGCAVKNFQDVSSAFGAGLGFTRRTRPIEVSSQNVSVCFVELSDNFYLELVTAVNGNTGLARYLKVGFYHICFLVENIDAVQEQLIALDYIPFERFDSEGFKGAPCQFFLSPQDHLIELAQLSQEEFHDFFIANLDNPG